MTFWEDVKNKILPSEVWKPIESYEEHYLISNLGRVRSVDREVKNSMTLSFRKGVLLSPHKTNQYPTVTLTKNNTNKTVSIHRLVAFHFIPNPKKLPWVNHIDGNKKNFRWSNLEWCNESENTNHSFLKLKRKGSNFNRKGVLNHLSLPVLQIDKQTGIVIKEYAAQADAQRITGILKVNICQCCNGKRKTAGGFIWKHKPNHTNEKTIQQIDVTTNKIINEFRITKDAAKHIGISEGSIVNCLDGRTKTAGGFIWRKKTPNKKQIDIYKIPTSKIKKLKQEVWKEIEGYEGIYLVSSFGRVKSLNRFIRTKNFALTLKREKLLKPSSNNGYMSVTLQRDGKKKNYLIHRLVANSFISNTEGKREVNHENGNTSDNRVVNLSWVSPQENLLHSFNVLKNKSPMFNRKGIKNHSSKPVLQINSKNNKVICEFGSIYEAERITKVFASNISACCRNRPMHQTAGGFKWQFKSNHIFKPIKQINLETGEIINEYFSLTEAAKKLNIARTGIGSCVKGERKQFAGYKWARIFSS